MAEINKYKILVVDDSEINRSILTDILDDRYETIEAEDGVQAVELIKKHGSDISLILLDLVMPNMDGLEVLAAMNQGHWIEDIPVIMISAENSPTYIERAYELGATDYINRPFNVSVVQKRVANTIVLYAKQKSLVNLVNEQVYEKEKNSSIMINILSHIVEFRNGESGLHVLHINIITEALLKQLIKKTDKYNLSYNDISTIVTASSLHDIGKIAVPDEILNKPGRLTPQEFEIIKTHSQAGADMLSAMTDYLNEPLVITAKDICLYHHERYDGRGYPKGLVGEEIPISAQVVSIADVYDALTSERCYKKAYSHEKALEMIKNGECGEFNPILIDCLFEVGDFINEELKIKSSTKHSVHAIKKMTDQMLKQEKFSYANKSINLLEQARIKYEFFASMSHEIQFEYSVFPSMLTISDWCAEKFNLPTVIMNPGKNERVVEILGEDTIAAFLENCKKTSYENPIIQFDVSINIDGEQRVHRIHCRVSWTQEEPSNIVNVIGKVVDIEDERRQLERLERKASIDMLTKLSNHGFAKEAVKGLLKIADERKYALVLFDLDKFKSANDNYGHMFGDKVLKTVAQKLIGATRKDDIVSRIGGDEFMLFIEYNDKDILDRIIKRVFTTINGTMCDDYKIEISMGIASTEDVGYDYDTLFNCADTALYHSKRIGRGVYNYYNKTMQMNESEITPIDN